MAKYIVEIEIDDKGDLWTDHSITRAVRALTGVLTEDWNTWSVRLAGLDENKAYTTVGEWKVVNG